MFRTRLELISAVAISAVQKILFSKIDSSLYSSLRGNTPKLATSDGVYLRGLPPGQWALSNTAPKKRRSDGVPLAKLSPI